MKKLLFLDVETTGTDDKKNGIHQIAAAIDINGVIQANFKMDFVPHPGAKYDPQTVKWWKENPDLGLSCESIQAREFTAERAYHEFVNFLDTYADKWNKADKFTFVGYNAHFDEVFIRAFMDIFKDHPIFSLYGNYIFSGRIDVLSMVADDLAEQRHLVPSITLENAAEHYGLLIPEGEDIFHSADVDIAMTRDIYYKLKSKKNGS